VQLWDPETGERVGRPLSGTDAVAFSPDGSLLASAGSTVRMWDPASSEPVGRPLTGHRHAPTAVAFSPDGKRLASASDDGVRLWRPLWDIGEACRLAAPYVTQAQVRAYAPTGWELDCRYSD
jgi:WD40 repeat protein